MQPYKAPEKTPDTSSITEEKLHQVTDYESTYLKLGDKGRRKLKSLFLWLGLSHSFSSILRFEFEMACLRLRCLLSFRYYRNLRKFRNKSNLRLHLGCGNRILQGWVNCDCYLPKDVSDEDSISFDLRQRLPFPDTSVIQLYSDSFFEHLFLEETNKMLKEIWRVLVPGGSMRIGVPDGELWIRSYLDSNTILHKWRDPKKLSVPYMFDINEISQNGGHKFLFDFPSLKYLLESNGFRNIVKYSAGDGSELCALDPKDEWRRAFTMYVECCKPE